MSIVHEVLTILEDFAGLPQTISDTNFNVNDYDPDFYVKQPDAKENTLYIQKPNAKLIKLGIHSLSLPPGWTCPSAKTCFTLAPRPVPIPGEVNKQGVQKYEAGRKVMAGEHATDLCFGNKGHLLMPATQDKCWNNWDLLLKAGTIKKMAGLINRSLDNVPRRSLKIFRIHAVGDFFSPEYFLAWLEVAKRRKNTLFYCYTKSIGMLKPHLGKVPINFRITFSLGGYFDKWVIDNRMKFADIVRSEKEARDYIWYDSKNQKRIGLEIEPPDDDKLAIESNKPFALLLHKGSNIKNPVNIQPEVWDKFKNRLKMIKAGKGYKLLESINNSYDPESIYHQIMEDYIHRMNCPKCSKRSH